MDSPPLGAARALRAAGHEVSLLLSAQTGAYGRRSLLAIDPDDTIVSPPGAGAGLPAIPPRLVHAAHGRGVWIGAVSYDAGLGLLGISSRHESPDPALVAGYHAAYAAYDHAAGSWSVLGEGPTTGVLAAAVAGELEAPDEDAPLPAPRTARSPVTRGEHADACREVQRLIALGEAFEVNLAHVIETPWDAGGWALLERLLDAGPGDHAAYLALGGVELASVSPELFLRIEDGVAETRPIKGTRRRGRTAAEDEALARELAGSEKDRAENVMIVDLLRNDLTATAEAGSVRVGAVCAVERTASVMHLVSSVTSRVREGIRLPDVLVSCFPGGSITGAPKRRAMELIDRLERGPRGFYCGSVFGWEPAERRLVASIAIRTATVADGRARYGCGGAVTLLSDAEEEAEETLVKARPFIDATNARLEGVVALYETLLVEERHVRLPDRHLGRLARAGVHPAVLQEVAEELTRTCRAAEGPTVVRVDVAADGAVSSATRAPKRDVAVRLLPVAGYDPADARREQKRADRSWADAPEAQAAVARFDEPLLVSDEGLVGETSRANVVAILADGTLVTPPVRGLLPGVTRSWVLEQLPVAERELGLLELLEARAAFLTTAGRGVVRVAAVGGTALGDDPRIAELQRAWRAL